MRKKYITLIFSQNFLLPCSTLLLIFLFMIYPVEISTASSKGIYLWLCVVFPSLFPFLVMLDILEQTSFIKSFGDFLRPLSKPLFNLSGSGTLPVFIGIIGGFPLGAKMTSSLFDRGLLSKDESERILAISSNASPAFIFGAVSAGLLHAPQVGIYLFLSQVLSILTLAIVSGLKARINNYFHKVKSCPEYALPEPPCNTVSKNSAELICDAVSNSVITILKVGGFIILFSVLSDCLSMFILSPIFSIASNVFESSSQYLNTFLFPILDAILCGILEITNGVNKVSQLYLPLYNKTILISAIIGFSGICVHLQTALFAKKSNLRLKLFVRTKFVQGFLAPIYTAILLYILKPNDIFVMSTSNNMSALTQGSMIHFTYSIAPILPSIINLGFITVTFIYLFILTLRKASAKQQGIDVQGSKN